jgi:hypothetical protein
MAPIKGMQVDLITHGDADSGTDDEVYIGFFGTGGGREFPLSVTGFEDFETGSQVRYVLGGEPAPVPTIAQRPDRSKPGQDNDPGRLEVELASVQYVYIRKAGYHTADDDDAFKVQSVVVILYGLPGTGGRTFSLTSRQGVWLGHEHGHTAWLRDIEIKG